MSGAATARVTSNREAVGLVTAFKAPLLDRILDEAEPERRQVVLDLGAPSEALLERLSTTRPCRVEIADLAAHGGVDLLNAPEAGDEVDAAPIAPIAPLLPAPNGERLDLIFCWDLPNYLGLKALRELCAHLGRRAAPGCRLHMLIAYSKREMPRAPARYVPQTDGKLSQRCADGTLVPAPRYSPEDLSLAVGGFAYERGVLLANGMQEFVYAWPR